MFSPKDKRYENSLLVMLIVLLSLGSARSGYSDDTKKLAEQGNPKAQFDLGAMYRTGEGASKHFFFSMSLDGLNYRLIMFF